jgi:hypothetical protein
MLESFYFNYWKVSILQVEPFTNKLGHMHCHIYGYQTNDSRQYISMIRNYCEIVPKKKLWEKFEEIS